MNHVFHHNDLDGICAAAIVYKAMSGQECVFHRVDYKDKISFQGLCWYDSVYIVDFSFKPEVMNALLEITDNIVWIDHHKTAAAYQYTKELSGLRDFKESWSGCELAWKYFFPDAPAPKAVTLVGDYDVWRLKEPMVFEFQEGLKMRGWEPQHFFWQDLLRGDEALLEGIKGEGSVALQYRDQYCEAMLRDFGYRADFEGQKCVVLNLYRNGSKTFDSIKAKDFDVMVVYIHDGSKFTVSLYSETVDVGEIAKKHGGGGHLKAAGFECERLPFAPIGRI